MEPFLRENDVSPMCRMRLSESFDDPVSARDLGLELAAIIDAGKHFVSATYYLEGDGPLVFSCYERLSALAHAIAIESYPNTATIQSVGCTSKGLHYPRIQILPAQVQYGIS